jgi:urease accessory protein
LVNPSGGLVGGDTVSVEARLREDTHALITSPSANRVYRSLSEPAIQDVYLSLGPGARLEWFPEVTIPFSGSRFRQSIRVDLERGATVVLWDAMASGRIARQERWTFASFDNAIHVRTASGASVRERFRITPATVGRLAADWNYAGSLFVIGEEIASEIMKELKGVLADLLERWPGEVLGGISEPAAPGLAIKVVARSAPGLSDALAAISATVRAHLWRLPAAGLRRY